MNNSKNDSLKLVQERFRMTFEQAAVGIAHVAPDGRFMRINQKFCEIVGFTKEEMLARTFQEITHPEDLDLDLNYVQQLLDKEIETYSMEKRYFRKDKIIIWVNLTVSLVREDSGEPSYFISVVEDITIRKRAEETAEESFRFQELAAKIFSRFINLPTDQIDQAIEDLLREVGKFFDADRAVIAQLSATGKVLKTTHIWYSEQFDMERLKAHDIKVSYPNFTNHLIHEDTWSFTNPDEYSHWPEVKEVCDFTGIKSGIAIKLNFDGQTLEMFDIVSIRSNRVWDKDSIERVKFLGQVFTTALSRKQAEEEFKKHAEFEQLVSRISAKFIGLSGVEFEQAIFDSLAVIGQYFKSDSVRLYRLSLQGDVVKIRNMWQEEHLAPQGEMPEIHKVKYPNLAAHYSRGESVVFNKFDDSPQWSEMRKILKFFGTKAGVGVPLEVDSTGVDIFAMDRVQSEHDWPKDIIEQSKAIGKVILSAMRRREAEVDLQDSYNKIKQLKDQLLAENISLREEIKLEHDFEDIIGNNENFKYILHRVEEVSKTGSNVLILGETGTGKELIARAIHAASQRKDKPLIRVNCAALSANMIESEIFGHEKGAFTGAHSKRIGRFELANGATLFLDEIAELPMELQAKLLRVLEEGEFERLGSSKTIKVDVRIITSTNRDLNRAVNEGRFRQDLFFRLDVYSITIPPLRQRLEDIPLLVRHFVNFYNKKLSKEIEHISQLTISMLKSYSWPGNIRELKNIIERSVIDSKGNQLQIQLPNIKTSLDIEKQTLEEIERKHITEILESTNWKIGGERGAAKILGLPRTTLQTKIKKLGITHPR
jgi:PAS domain S-box-containing protein